MNLQAINTSQLCSSLLNDKKFFLGILISSLCWMAFLTLLFMKGAAIHEPFVWVALLCFPLCYFSRLTGIGLTFLVLASGGIFYVWRGYDLTLWECGLIVSCILMSVITVLSLDEAKSYLELIKKELMEKEQLNEKYQQHLDYIEEKGLKEQELLKEELIEKEAQLNQVLQSQKQRQAVLNDLEKQLATHKEQVKNDALALLELKKEAFSLNERLNVSSRFQKEHQMQEVVLAEMSDHIETLSREKGLLEKTLKQLQEELEALQKEKEAFKQQDKTPFIQNPDPFILGKLNQLKEQFQEKAKILNSTRKELFYANERIAVLQKKIEEKELFERNENEVYLEKMLISLEEEFRQQALLDKQEVTSLEELVAHLSK